MCPCRPCIRGPQHDEGWQSLILQATEGEGGEISQRSTEYRERAKGVIISTKGHIAAGEAAKLQVKERVPRSIIRGNTNLGYDLTVMSTYRRITTYIQY